MASVMRRATEAATTLGVARPAWDRQVVTTVGPAAVLVVGGWALMAWSRFGAQGLAAPRAAVRFVLIGFYAWLGLAALVWAAGQLAGRRPAGGPAGPGRRQRPDPVRIVQVTGLAHRPLLLLGFAVQFAAVLLRLDGPGFVLAVAALGLWMPAMLVAAARSVFDLAPGRAAAVVAVPYLLWLATAGRFLLDQVGHLL